MFKHTRLNALKDGGAKQDRTADLLRARQALSQLSYSPIILPNVKLVGLGRLELPTSPLSGVRSNQLSYKPIVVPSTRWCSLSRYNKTICVSTAQYKVTSIV